MGAVSSVQNNEAQLERKRLIRESFNRLSDALNERAKSEEGKGTFLCPNGSETECDSKDEFELAERQKRVEIAKQLEVETSSNNDRHGNVAAQIILYVENTRLEYTKALLLRDSMLE